jgi:amino acid adenylation domain-containing protein
MTLLTAFQILLSRYSGQEDIVVGTPIAGRGRPEVEALIGFFVNTLVVRTDCSGNPTFLQMLRRVRDVMLDAYANQDVPFEKVVQHLHVERDVGRNPLFQIMFQLRTAPRRSRSGPAYDPPIPVERNTSIFDLSISLWESQDVLEGSIEYSTDLFHPETISRLASHYQTLLEAVISNPEQRIRDLPLLTPSERSELLAKWNGAEPPPLTNDRIHRVVEAVVENVPDSIAVAFEEYRITYRDLNERANRLAHYLCDLEIGPDVLVGICLDRSPEMVVAILAILKAGGAYLPLDPAYPQERIAFILRDAQPRIVLTTRTLANKVSGHNVRAICLDNISKVFARKSSMNLPERATSDNLAYVIYTSGSTGTPKGVLVCHRGLCNVAESQVALLPLGRNDHVLQFASLTFDASIFEMLLAFGAGATLYLAKQQDLLPGAPLNEFINTNGITVVTLPPSVLATLSPDRCSSLTTILVAGEACSAALVAMWSPGRHFFNLYGPTEATIWSTAARCTVGTVKRSPPIGRPIPRTKIYVLDGNAQPAPIGIPGEIHIGGYGLARGYLSLPELTNQRFITVGFTDSGKERLYKTGDLARYLPDGQIEFLGRVDDQLKVRGFRIEPGEIETKLKQHQSIQDAIVIATDGDAGARSLVAYIVPVPGKVIVQTELSDFLEERLPKFMVPAQYMFLEALPRLPSGKVARKMLPKPTPTTTTQAHEFMPPQSALEQSIANVWKEILKLERVGVEDNFFDLGGNSLSLAALHARVAQLVSKEVPLIEMFRRPTIRSLVSYVDSSAVGTSAGSSHVRERAQRKLAVAQHNYR